MSQAGILNVIENNPSIPTQFNADVGFAIPLGNILNIFGTAAQGVSTAGAGNTITITVDNTTTSSKGVAQFNPADFTVTAGVVSLLGGGAAIDSIAVQTGTSPIVPTGGGLVTINGAVVSAGTNPVRTDGTGANTMAVEIQISQAIAATDATKIGLSNFNSAHFSVDANGFVSLAGAGLAVDSFAVQTGTSPVVPASNGLVTFSGAVTPAGTNPVRTDGTGPNTMVLEVQISQALAATDATKIGLSNFDSAAFDVDANGFVQLNGGGIASTSFTVDANTAPGTNPVVPTASGSVTIEAAAVVAHSVPIETRSRAANTFKVEVQEASAVASTDATKSGIAHFDSAVFTVDTNGFVSLAGGSLAIDSIGVDATTGGGTNPVLPTAAGLVTVNGARVAAGTNPIRSVSTAANVYQIQVQTSQALAATDATKVGLCNFDSASFGVDANGFVTMTGGGGFTWNDVSGAFSPLKNNGYFITGTATGTLPAAPAQGDTIKFFVDHASQLLTIQATAGKIIRLGSLVSSSGGTFVSTLQGDSVELTYRASDSCWCAIAGWSGTWTFT